MPDTGVVFDLDGTLIDSAPDIRAVANEQLKRFDAPPLSLGETRAFIGGGVDRFVARMRAARDIAAVEHDRILAGFMASYDSAVALTKPYPFVERSLRALHGHGVKLGICTNKPVSPARSVLRHLSLERYFDTVIGGDSFPVKKPDPAVLLKAFDDLGVRKRIYVGDSEIDAQTAEKAGVVFILFAGGYRQSALDEMDFARQIEDFSSLVALVSEMATNMTNMTNMKATNTQ